MRRPGKVRATGSRTFGLLLALAAWVVLAQPAAALDVTVGAPHERGGYVIVDVRLHDPFGDRIEESLSRGMPATMQVHAELWRRRNGWFDRLESTFEAFVRIRYDAWNDQFRIERPGASPILLSSIDAVEGALSRPWSLPVGRVGQLEPHVSYYVVVFATLKPLSVEDVAEVEGWLSGEVRTGRGGGLAVITALPRSIFDAARNFAGFGDRRARGASSHFELQDLFPQAP